MSTITADLVKQLRDRTQVSMMDCKKALVETQGDIELAIEVLRKKGQVKAASKGDRIAAEGLTFISNGTILELNCETDFVAKDANFNAFGQKLVAIAASEKAQDLAVLANKEFEAGKTVEEARLDLISKIGENISIRRVASISASDILGSYSHGGRIGVLVAMQGGNEQVAKDIAMHIAASNPSVIKPEEISQQTIDKEREIYMSQAETSGKPAEIVAKMIDGKIKKFVEEVSLVGQAFVKNPDIKVGDYLKQHQASVIQFIRFEVGEGIEKPVTDFAAEVMAQVNN